MVDKKTLTEKEINELSEEQLMKVSGGYSNGDICPSCKKGTLIYNVQLAEFCCNFCSHTISDPNSGGYCV